MTEPASGQAPASAIQALITRVIDLDLNRGVERALVSKLRTALESVERGRDRAARNSLSAFVNQINALDEKKLARQIATELRTSALAIIESI